MLLLVTLSAAAAGLSPLAVVERVGRSTVVIQGVLHGSASSAADVRRALVERPPDVIVLELCDARWKSLSSRPRNQTALDDLRRLKGSVSRTASAVGPVPAAFAGVVGVLYAVARAAGFDPGIEFTIPLEFARTRGVDVVLGDRDVIATFSSKGGDVARGYQTLWRAVRDSRGGINLAAAVAEPGRLTEFLRLFAAVSLVVSPVAAATPTLDHFLPLVDVLAALSAILLFGNVGALLVDARDEVLAASIRSALELAEASAKTGSPTILVVVGGLHVNGVRARLLRD